MTDTSPPTRRRLSPRELRIESLELRVALGGRSADRSRQELEALLADEESNNESSA